MFDRLELVYLPCRDVAAAELELTREELARLDNGQRGQLRAATDRPSLIGNSHRTADRQLVRAHRKLEDARRRSAEVG